MLNCIKCGSDSRGRKYCYSCGERRSNVCSILNQNKKKLAKICTGRSSYDAKWIYHYRLYTGNINKCLDELDEFNKAEEEFFRQYGKDSA